MGYVSLPEGNIIETYWTKQLNHMGHSLKVVKNIHESTFRTDRIGSERAAPKAETIANQVEFNRKMRYPVRYLITRKTTPKERFRKFLSKFSAPRSLT